MRIACLKHVPYEGPAYFPEWAARSGYVLDEFLVPDVGLPAVSQHERVIVIGGPMSVWETERYPWLREEKRFLAHVYDAGIPILGICLGAQLLAEHLGARVAPGPAKEIGWHMLSANPAAQSTWLGEALPEAFVSFLWHGDFFDLPPGAVPVAASEAHPIQAFVHGASLGLQFHLEVTASWARRLIERDAHELVDGPFIQSAAEIESAPDTHYDRNHRLLDRVMDRWMA